MVNDYHILAMEYATEEELDVIKNYALKINDILSAYLKDAGIELIDFKLEFGKTADGTIVLADEISPIPAASGIQRLTRSWIWTDSEEISAAWKTPIRKS